MTFSFYLYCIHTWEFVLRLFHVSHLWLNLLSYHGNPSVFFFVFFVVLGSWRYISPAVPYRRLSYEMKIQTIFSVHVFMYMRSAPFYLISCFLFIACYFQRSTTHVIMLLIVLVSIESNFINISFPLKKNVISPYEKKIYPCLVTSKEELVSSNLFLIGQLTYFGICDI